MAKKGKKLNLQRKAAKREMLKNFKKRYREIRSLRGQLVYLESLYCHGIGIVTDFSVAHLDLHLWERIKELEGGVLEQFDRVAELIPVDESKDL